MTAPRDALARTAERSAHPHLARLADALEEKARAEGAGRAGGAGTPVVMVCGVDCHTGDVHCNGYCTGAVDMPPPWPTGALDATADAAAVLPSLGLEALRAAIALARQNRTGVMLSWEMAAGIARGYELALSGGGAR